MKNPTREFSGMILESRWGFGYRGRNGGKVHKMHYEVVIALTEPAKAGTFAARFERNRSAAIGTNEPALVIFTAAASCHGNGQFANGARPVAHFTEADVTCARCKPDLA